MQQSYVVRCVLVLAALVSCGTPSHPAAPAKPAFDEKALDAFVVRAMTELEVPGASVAIVRDGAIAYEKAFGVRSAKGEPVTAATLFMIGSITKTMTTLMEAALVDAGKFRWDTPVTEVLPSFALGDPVVTKKVAMWHMSCACTGMPRQDMEYIFEFDGVTPEQRIASMKTMKPTTGFGETFQYSNLMVSAGGFAAAHAFDPKGSLGDAYDAAMQKNVFDPIGMTASTLDFKKVEAADHAMPHALAIDGTRRELPLAIERNVLPIRPAGGVWSNAHDMARYAMTELAKGISPDGKRVVSEANLTERLKPRVREDETSSYGLGIGVATQDGLRVVRHNGGSFGFGATLVMFPEQRSAIVILTNIRNGGPSAQLPFNDAVERKAIELLFAKEDRARAKLEEFVKARSAPKPSYEQPDAAWLAKLAGTYTNASLGKVIISGNEFDAGEWKMKFGRRKDPDGMKMVFLDPPFAGSAIAVSADTKPIFTIEDGPLKYVFER